MKKEISFCLIVLITQFVFSQKDTLDIKCLKTYSKEIISESTEGGLVYYKCEKNKLKSIDVEFFGEMGKRKIIYKIINKKRVLIQDYNIKYNRPIYYDSIMMKENNDNQIFNIKKSDTIFLKGFLYELKGMIFYKKTLKELLNNHNK